MNKKDFIKYNERLVGGHRLDPDSDLDVFDKYHIERMNELIHKNNDELAKAASNNSLNGLDVRIFDLSKMLTVNESAILRLYAVALDPISSNRDLLNSFNIFINDVISRHNSALRKLSERINKHRR